VQHRGEIRITHEVGLRVLRDGGAAFTPQGYLRIGGSNITVPNSMQFIEMYNYTKPGLTAMKRLQVEETLQYYTTGNILHDVPQTLNLDGVYTYDNEGKMTR
jgi:hypothetical protein